MNIGLTRGKPDPVKSAEYAQLDRRIRLLQAQSTALYENDEISVAELAARVAPINAEIAELIDRLYLPTKSRSRAYRVKLGNDRFGRFARLAVVQNDIGPGRVYVARDRTSDPLRRSGDQNRFTNHASP